MRARPARLRIAALAGCTTLSLSATAGAVEAAASDRAPQAEVTSTASPPAAAPAERWSRPYFTAAALYNGLYGPGAALEVFPHPRWTVGLELASSGLGLFVTGHLHFVPELRRGRRHHQLLLGFGGDVGVTPSSAAGGLAAWLAPTVDLRYLGRPRASLGLTLGARCGAGFSWEARDLTRARQPSTPLDHLALVFVTYAGLSFGHHGRR
ncbi:MAG: hypothetical protein U1A78_24400 [Polyangia bacterium]